MAIAQVDIDDMQNEPNQPRRHVDRQIPMGVIVVMLLNLGAGIWFAATYASTINEHSEKITIIEKHDQETDEQIIDIRTSLAVLKDRSKDSQDTAHRIEDILRQPPNRR